jgi:hypothetical protein
MNEPTPERLRELADLLERPTKDGARIAREGMRDCADAWEADRAHRDRLVRGVEHDGKRHPWYGPCDGFADGGCCECDRLFAAQEARIEALETIYLRHIHEHRLGTNATADDCPSCRELMEKALATLAEEEKKP